MEIAHTVTGVGVLDKGVAIIDLCEARPRSAAEIARDLGITIPTAHRLMSALAAHDLLARDDEGRFSLGVRMHSSRMGELAVPILERTTAAIGETSQLWVSRGAYRLCTASVVSTAELRVAVAPGMRLRLADGGSAASVLLGDVSESGWVESIAQRTPGVGSVSAPVLSGGRTVGAVCVIAPLSRVPTTPGQLYGDAAIAAAAELAELVG
ncbi:MAG: helix-turn-helix domain-containing protein [Nocardioidaceae bacterium]